MTASSLEDESQSWFNSVINLHSLIQQHILLFQQQFYIISSYQSSQTSHVLSKQSNQNCSL